MSSNGSQDRIRTVMQNNFRNANFIDQRGLLLKLYGNELARDLYGYIQHFLFYQEIQLEMDRVRRDFPPQRIGDLGKKSLWEILGIMKSFARELFSGLGLSSQEEIRRLGVAIVPSAYQYHLGSLSHRKACDQIFLRINDVPTTGRERIYRILNRLNQCIETLSTLPISRVLRVEKIM